MDPAAACSTVVFTVPNVFDSASISQSGFNTVKFFSPEPMKALVPMLVTLSGIVTFVRLRHVRNAMLPMLVTLFPSAKLLKLAQK